MERFEETSSLCRVCLQIGEYEIHSGLINLNDEWLLISTMLKEFTSLEFNVETEGIPSLICPECTDNLIECYKFKLKIQKADKFITGLLEQDCSNIKSEILAETSEDHNDNYEEIIHHNQNEQFTFQLCDEDEELSNEFVKLPNKTQKRATTTKSNINRIKTSRQNSNLGEAKNCADVFSNFSKYIEKPTDNCHRTNNEFTNNVSFVITKFIPSAVVNMETKTDTQKLINNSGPSKNKDKDSRSDCDDAEDNTHNTVEHKTVKNMNIVRTYDLAAVEIESSNFIEFDRLVGNNYDDDEDDGDNNDSNSETIYACKYCPRAFASSYFLKQHARKSHVCQFCMKGFEKCTQLFQHVREEHNEFPCPICRKKYSSNSNLRQHMKRVHTFKLPAHTSLLSFKKKDTTNYLSGLE